MSQAEAQLRPDEAAAKAAPEYPASERRRRLTPAALQVASEKVPAPYSQVVIGGVVRLVDFCLIAAAGLGLCALKVSGGFQRLGGGRWSTRAAYACSSPLRPTC